MLVGGREEGCGRGGGKEGLWERTGFVPSWGYKWMKYSGFWRLCSRRGQWSVRYWEPKRIIRSLKIPHLPMGTWHNSMWNTPSRHDKVSQFQHKTGVTSAGFLAAFAQLFWATLRRLEQLVTDTEELRRRVVFPFEKTVTISAWAQMELNKSLVCARSSEWALFLLSVAGG